MRIYLAGPPYPNPDNYRADAIRLLEWRATPVNPMDRDFRGNTLGHEEEIVRGDIAEITSCDAVLADFSQHDPGTSMECWFAWSINVPVVVYAGDLVPHPWVRFIARSVHMSLREACGALLHGLA